MQHKIKIQEPYYKAVIEGRKTFEIRYNDRGYQVGDTVIMTPYDGQVRCYGDDEISATIGYVLGYQQKENWVVFSLIDVKVVKG